MASKLVLPKSCPSDAYLLVAVSSKYSHKKINVTASEENDLNLVIQSSDANAQPKTLTQPIAIANYLLEDTKLLANKEIDGPDFPKVRNNINEYVSIAGNLITPSAAIKTHPAFNARAPEKDKSILAQNDKTLSSILKDLNQHLQLNTFLAAERLTLADLAVASSLVLLYRSGLQTKDSENSRFLNRWFKTVANQSQFLKSQNESGEITYFPSEALKFDGKKFAEFKNGETSKPKTAAKGQGEAMKNKKPDESGDAMKNMDPKKLAKIKEF